MKLELPALITLFTCKHEYKLYKNSSVIRNRGDTKKSPDDTEFHRLHCIFAGKNVYAAYSHGFKSVNSECLPFFS